VSERKTKLVDCDPKWADSYGEVEAGATHVMFDCPEGHEGCWHHIPFTPSLNGQAMTSAHAIWQRTGETFETLTLSPSIATRPPRPNGCALHIHIANGQIEFCGDSK
jgi:hypothetical protein